MTNRDAAVKFLRDLADYLDEHFDSGRFELRATLTRPTPPLISGNVVAARPDSVERFEVDLDMANADAEEATPQHVERRETTPSSAPDPTTTTRPRHRRRAQVEMKTSAEQRALRARARAAGKTVSDYVRALILTAPRDFGDAP